ncbi:chitinase-3-like protein 1 [Harpegnathos saltator]|nr:chitinase-3-like protein 1 [Harpegnathos saltator]XP_025153429.1 chitinase-3-like protein 1 [Harpegnathos saltator]
MNRWIFALAALAALASAAPDHESQTDRIVCYYGSWAVYRPGSGKCSVEDIDPTLCTHLIYTFVGISTEGDVRVLDSWNDLSDNYGKDAFGRFNALRKLSPSTKTLVAIGGWNEGSLKYSTVMANSATRARFVKNVVDFTLKYNFDGFDLDWEYPNQRGGKPEDVQNFVSLTKELRTEFDKHGLILSAAVGAAETSASQSYNIPEISKYLHFINIMSYDLHGSWEKHTGHNAPLYARPDETGNDLKLNVDACVNYWLDQGCPPNKIVVGVPFYGRSFTLADPKNNGLRAPTTGPGAAGQYTREGGMLGYNEICTNLKQGWSMVRQEDSTPYAYNGNQWVGYDDVTSLKVKTNYIKSKKLGGVMLWSVETDDFRGECGVKYPLLKTLNAELRGGVPVPPPVDPKPTEKPFTTQPPATQPPATQPPMPPPSGLCTKNGFVRDPNDCSKFYQCANNGGTWQMTPFHCPSGTAFDPQINGCNHRSSVPGCN